MKNVVKQLSKQVPPPARPVEHTGDWKVVEKQMQTSLPADYKELIERYGSGTFFDFIVPFNPFTANRHTDLVKRSHAALKGLRKAASDVLRMYPGEEFHRSIVERIDGNIILPWGYGYNGEDLLWRKDGPPDRWTIIVLEYRSHLEEEFSVSLTEFLLGLATEKLSSSIFPDLSEGDGFNFRSSAVKDQ